MSRFIYSQWNTKHFPTPFSQVYQVHGHQQPLNRQMEVIMKSKQIKMLNRAVQMRICPLSHLSPFLAHMCFLFTQLKTIFCFRIEGVYFSSKSI